jgi:hypothetical protein
MRTTKESVKVKIIKYKNSSTPARIPVSAFTLATGEQKKWVYRKFVELYANQNNSAYGCIHRVCSRMR